MFQTPLPISCPMQYPNSQGWPHPYWWSTHHSSHRKEESTPSNSLRSPRHNWVPVVCSTMCLLACNQYKYQMHSLKHVMYVNNIVHQNHDSQFSQPTVPEFSPGISMVQTSSTMIDLSALFALTNTPKMLIICRTHHPNTMHLYEGVICRTWDFRILTYLTMAHNL